MSECPSVTAGARQCMSSQGHSTLLARENACSPLLAVAGLQGSSYGIRPTPGSRDNSRCRAVRQASVRQPEGWPFFPAGCQYSSPRATGTLPSQVSFLRESAVLAPSEWVSYRNTRSGLSSKRRTHNTPVGRAQPVGSVFQETRATRMVRRRQRSISVRRARGVISGSSARPAP